LLIYVELIQAVLDEMSFLALTKLNINRQTFKISVTAAAAAAPAAAVQKKGT
jgi:hypothetical protein